MCRDCAIAAFESAQNFARKRANVSQVLLDSDAPRTQKLDRRALRALFNLHDVSAARGEVITAFFDEISGLRRSKARKISRENARSNGCKTVQICLISAHRQCKTRPACTACAAQHARCQRSARPSQRCIWHRDCATSAFESAQNFARKRANVWQILFDSGALST